MGKCCLWVACGDLGFGGFCSVRPACFLILRIVLRLLFTVGFLFACAWVIFV